jgi:hypothetical protein
MHTFRLGREEDLPYEKSKQPRRTPAYRSFESCGNSPRALIQVVSAVNNVEVNNMAHLVELVDAAIDTPGSVTLV